MKKPEPIHYETDEEYYKSIQEWEKINILYALVRWCIVLFTFGLILLSIYLYIWASSIHNY